MAHALDVTSSGIASAGVRADSHGVACSLAAHLAASKFGSDLIAFQETRPRGLDLRSIRQARLILVAERSQRASIARLSPESRAITFTLLEAEKLSAAVAEEAPLEANSERARFIEFVDRMNSLRGMVAVSPKPRRFGPPRAGGYDIPDGHNQNPKAHRDALQLVSRSSAAIAKNLLVAVRPEGTIELSA